MKLSQIKSKSCRVCGSQTISEQSGYTYSWFKCANCRTVNRDISETEFLKLNPTYDPGDCPVGLTKDELMRLLNVQEKKVFLTDNLGNLASLPNSTLLDIGCGIGGYLIAGQELGFSCTGIEPSISHSKIGKEVFGLNIVNVFFDESALEGKTFDIILMSHVVEHIFNPKQFLEIASKKLNPGGVILVTTPNIESLSAKFSGKYWSMYKPIDHVTLIGPAAIPFICPPNTKYSCSTSEYLGEFLAGLFISLRDRLQNIGFYKNKRHLKDRNNAATLINSNRSPSRRIIGFLIAVANIPFFLITKLLNRQACLFIRISTKPKEFCD